LILGYSIIFTAPGVFAPPYINAEPTHQITERSRSAGQNYKNLNIFLISQLQGLAQMAEVPYLALQ